MAWYKVGYSHLTCIHCFGQYHEANRREALIDPSLSYIDPQPRPNRCTLYQLRDRRMCWSKNKIQL